MKKTLKSIITGTLAASMLLTSSFAASAAISPSEPVTNGSGQDDTAIICFHTKNEYDDEIKIKGKIAAHVGDIVEISVSPKIPSEDYVYPVNSQFKTFFNLSDLKQEDVFCQNNHILEYYERYYKPAGKGKYTVYDTEKIAPGYCINTYDYYRGYCFKNGNVNGLCFNHSQIQSLPTAEEMGNYLSFTVKVLKPGVCHVLTELYAATFSKAEESHTHRENMLSNEINVSGRVVGKADPKYLLGDVTLDGNVSIKDVTTIQKYLAKTTSLDSDALYRANVKHSGKCSIDDATLIQKYLAKQIISFM